MRVLGHTFTRTLSSYRSIVRRGRTATLELSLLMNYLHAPSERCARDMPGAFRKFWGPIRFIERRKQMRICISPGPLLSLLSKLVFKYLLARSARGPTKSCSTSAELKPVIYFIMQAGFPGHSETTRSLLEEENV